MATEEDPMSQAEPTSPPGDLSPTDSPIGSVESTEDSTDAAIAQTANLFLTVRRLLFMSLGALALTADEARDLVDRLSERGDIAQANDLSHGLGQSVVKEELEHWLDDLHHEHPLHQRPLNSPDTYPLHHNDGAGRGDAFWGSLRVPTRRELESVSRKINELDQKLSALRAQRASKAAPLSGPATPPEP